MGRWTSPDPSSPLQRARSQDEQDEYLSNPQYWNKYAYSINNPLKYVDPDGEWAILIQLAQRLSPYADRAARAAQLYGQQAVQAASRYGQQARMWATQFFNSPTGQEITQATIETAIGSEAPNLTPASPVGAVKGAFEVAAEGGRHAGFLRNYLGKSGKELERGIASIEREIATHLNKIKNPAKHIEGFDKLDPRQQQSLINKRWPSDVQRQREQLEILKRLREQQEQR
jgi:DNA primase